MPITTEDFHSSLYDLLRTKGYQPIPLDSKGKTSPFYPEADIFKFSFVKDGKKYGDVWATVDNALKLVLYYDDEVASSPTGDTAGAQVGDSWPSLLRHLKRWAQRRQLGFELKNKDHLVSDMQQREFMKKKERLGEGYYPMGKKASYNDAIPQVKIVIQHTKQIEEGEQRFRNVDRIFVENTEGERFAVPTKKPGLAKVYARHVAEGGTPYDDRGRHLTTLIEEYNKMVGFVRATKTGEFNESVQRVVNAGIDHYQSLRESLGKLTSHRGYHSYFDSWSPVLNEEQSDITEISTLFTKSNLDPRIESCIPILSKLTKLDEIKPVKELDSWADEVIRETTSIDLSKEGPTSLMPGAGKNTRTSRERDRERAKALSHYSKELAADHYGKEVEKSDQGVAEAYHNDVMHAWNSGMSDEEIIQRFGKSEFDRLKQKYGHGSIPVQDLLGLRSKEPEDKRVRLHRGLEGPGKALKSIIKQQNQKQGVTEGLDPDTQRLEQEVRDALANGDDYTAKSFAKMARTAADRNYLRKIIRQEMYGTGPGQGGVAEEKINEMNPMLVRDGLQVVIDFLSQYPQATALTAGAAGTAIVAKLVKNAWRNHKELEQLKQDVRDWSRQKLHANKNVSAKGGKVAKIIQTEIERRKQGVTEMDNRTPSGDRREQRANSPEEIAKREKEQQSDLKKVSPEMRKKLRLPEPKQGDTEGLDPDTQRLEQEVRDALANGDDYTAKSFAKMAQTAADRKYLQKIIRQEMYGTGPGQGGVAESDVVQGPWGRKPTFKPEVGGTGTSTADQEPSGLRQFLQDKYSRFDNITITWQSKDQMAQEVEWEEGEGFPPNLIGEFEVKFEEDSDEGYTMEVTDTWSVKSKNFNGRAPYELKRRARISAEMESLDPQQKKAGQLGPTEKAENISPVLGSPQHKHPFDGKLVGASESADLELKRLKALIE